MKFFLAFILSLIVLTETAVPCCVWDGCGQEERSADHPENKDKGVCSPFASCSTCMSGIEVARPVNISFAGPEPSIEHTATPQLFLLSTYHQALLQPPRYFFS